MTGPARPPGSNFWRHGDACVIVHFRLTPKSSKDRIDGVVDTRDGPALQAHVSALPEDGAANAALEWLVASWLDVPWRSVSLVSGAKSRLKAIRIDGDAADLARRLQDKLNDD